MSREEFRDTIHAIIGGLVLVILIAIIKTM